MMKNWTFGRKVGAGFMVSVIALIAIAVTGYRSTRSLILRIRSWVPTAKAVGSREYCRVTFPVTLREVLSQDSVKYQ